MALAAEPVEIVTFSLSCDEQARRALYGLLSDDEKRRAAAFRFDKHRNRFISGRARMREILAMRLDCAPADIDFQLNRYGKPSVGNPALPDALQFNASSSSSLGAIALATGMEIGLDIEKIKCGKLDDFDRIVKYQFTTAEYDWYRRHQASERNRIFYRLWTCKEAYLKALGIGLNGKLDGFSIDLQDREPSVSYSELENGGSSRIHLNQFEPEVEFVACLASPLPCSRIEISQWPDRYL